MVEALTADTLPAPHGFFTRRGGVSTGPFASLNCSLSGQDDPAAVLENRARAARLLGVDPPHLVGLTQVHGTEVMTVTDPWAPGAGQRADAMVTERGDIALGIVTADCAPVLFMDTGRNIVGAAHAGWRGAVLGVLEATIAAMTALGAATGRIVAAIGPCIGQASYEVGLDFRELVIARSEADSVFFVPGRREDHWQFDLAAYCATRLRSAGVRRVEIIGADTLIDEDRFFSHRRRTLAHRMANAGARSVASAGPIGHQISVIRPA
jgi:polyphenol oxidase